MDAYPLDGNGLCTVCREGAANFDTVYSLGSYEGSLQKLIHAFKYGRIETLAHPLGAWLAEAAPVDGKFDLVMPMPMHWRKRWARGFNQAELLARPVARKFGVGVGSHLRRSRATASQAGLSEAERQSNLSDSFVVRRAGEIEGKRVLLIDDVFTTGATLRAAAAALKAAGVKHVTALTLARVDVRRTSPAGVTSSVDGGSEQPPWGCQKGG